ncbi:hypothetical protein NPIL_630091 [Nephila pilipes]|uniref:Uncharacterized protein n=1 Tax=Nephila pilipes TaxID=299642 RepID=A0A8X6UUC4_NEPPI|nr:hypothetical protein NPIL_630091 [Nephila pilipes]
MLGIENNLCKHSKEATFQVCKNIVPRHPVNYQLYRNIFNPVVHPYAGIMSDSFVLQNGNTRLHIARLEESYLHEDIVVRMRWLVRFPDLCPTGYVWNDLGNVLLHLTSPSNSSGSSSCLDKTIGFTTN